MDETFLGILGLLLLTGVPIVIAFILFRRTPHGSGDIFLAIRNFIILLTIFGGPGFLIAIGLFFKINTLAVMGLLIYLIPILTIQLLDKIELLSALYKLIDSILPADGDDD